MADTTSTADDTDKDIVDDKGVPRKKPVNDAAEAHALAKRYFDDRKKANHNHGIVRLKYDGEPPYKVGAFEAQNQGWRANMSCKAMSTASQRCTTSLIKFVNDLRYLTASALPESKAPVPIPQAPTDNTDAFAAPNPVPVPSPQEKSELFQRKITALLRGWNGWLPLMYQLGNEDILFGYVTAACLDDVEWRPQAFSFDRFAGNSDASHDINEWDAIAFKKNFAIHELVSFIEDEKAAKDAGWDVDNVVDAINHSLPEDRRSTNWSDRTLRYADMIRDGNLAQSCRENARSVETYVVYYREYSGKVSQYIVLQDQPNTEGDHAKEEKSALFYAEDRFEHMAHIASLFSIQHGNGKFFGSIGIGRELFGPSLGMDRTFCRVLDLAYLMSLMRAPDDASNRNKSGFRMDGIMMYINASPDAIKALQPYEGNISALIEVINLLKGTIEERSNAYAPRQSEAGEEKSTATEIIDDARKEDQVTGDRLSRFYGQFCLLVEMIQRRVCSQDNIKEAAKFLEKEKEGKTLLPADEYAFYEQMRDKEEVAGQYAKYELPGHLDRDAVMLCVDLLRSGLEPLDIYRLSRAPANEPMGDTPDAMRQKILQAYQMFQANPAVDQYSFGKEAFAAVTNPQFAEEYWLPRNSNEAVALEQSQKQLLELGAMTAIGAPIPVLPSDDDVAHRNVLKPALATIPNDPQAIAANPIKHQALTLMSKHFNAHLAAGKQKGEHGEAFAQDSDMAEHYGALLNKADQIVASQAQPQQGSQPALPAPQPQQ